ncbi:hypothetical protein EDB19DRAFT_1595385, partial [Suillus lakei]
LNDLCHSIMYIDALRVASLNDPGTGMTADALERLRNPRCQPTTINDDVTATAIELYLNLSHADQDYVTTINSCACHLSPDDNEGFPSLYKVKKLVTELSGIDPIEHNMCINSCMAFTGLNSHLLMCSICSEAHYDPIKFKQSGGKEKVPRAVTTMFPLGPQLQALYHDPKSAEDMEYCRQQTEKMFDEL